MPCGSGSTEIRLHLVLETSNECFLLDQPCLSQENYVADITLIAPLQFRKREIVSFGNPQPQFRPYRPCSPQASFIRVRKVSHADLIDKDAMFLLKSRPLAGSGGYRRSHGLRRNAKNVQVSCFFEQIRNTD